MENLNKKVEDLSSITSIQKMVLDLKSKLHLLMDWL